MQRGRAVQPAVLAPPSLSQWCPWPAHLRTMCRAGRHPCQVLGTVDEKTDGIVIINTAGIIMAVNSAANTMFGYPKGELESKNVSCLMPQPFSGRHNGWVPLRLVRQVDWCSQLNPAPARHPSTAHSRGTACALPQRPPRLPPDSTRAAAAHAPQLPAALRHHGRVHDPQRPEAARGRGQGPHHVPPQPHSRQAVGLRPGAARRRQTVAAPGGTALQCHGRLAELP